MKRNTLKRLGIIVCMGMLTMTMLTACGEGDAATGNATASNSTASTVAEASVAESAEESAAPVAKENSEDDFRVDDEDGKIVIIGYEGESMDVVIPSAIDGKEVVAIGKNAFSNGEITSLVCPDTLKEIREKAFINCEEMEAITLNDGLETIGYGAFVNTSLKSIILPDSIKFVDEIAFSCRNTLSEITFSTSMSEIGAGAFQHMSGTTLTVPAHIKTVGRQAFCSSDNIETLIFEEGVEVLGEDVFEKCEALSSVTIPASVTEIGRIGKSDAEHIVFTVVAGSYAEQYMQEKGYNYVTQ